MPPRIAVTLGDVAGVGPEIVVKSLLAHPDLREACAPVVIGDVETVRRAAVALGHPADVVVSIAHPADARNDPRVIEVVQTGDPLPEVPLGRISATAGDAAYRFVVEACRLAREGAVDGIATAPLNKAAMHEGGHRWPGHTELLAHEFGVTDFSLVLSADDLYVFHLTTHVSLRDAIDQIDADRLDSVIGLAGAFRSAIGSTAGAIGLCGLNPHAGEGGLFGREEIELYTPAVERARAAGITIDGPLAADALLPAAFKGRWRIVIASYHDQGHAPFKSMYGDRGVNITVGLPVVRVSVDHGTAFDIAGTGVAREESMVLACRRAAELSLGWDAVWEVTRPHAR
jgi:4-phospho-D-threonate 3-dehydrogenase / 4-phospho-D-erythronate 3-dehydrogenase